MRLNKLLLVLCCISFILFGLAFIPYPGLQADELLFTDAYDTRWPPFFWISIFKLKAPFMLMTYVGALKAWIYWPIVRWLPPSVWAVRVPALLAGVTTILLFYHLLHRIAGQRAALLGTALLATDAAFLLTTTMDWGPTAIQHVALVGGMLLLVRFHHRPSLGRVFAAFAVFGLGMWDKALFIWLLMAMSVAGLIVYRREIFIFLKPRWLAAALCGFLLGALPLVIYNVRRPLETFRGNTRWATDPLWRKLVMLPRALNGEALFGVLPSEKWGQSPRRPTAWPERASVWLSDTVGERRRGLGWYGFAAALLLLSLAWRSRAAWFSLLFLALAWPQMLLTEGAGGGVHHTILLWPIPWLLVSAVFAEASSRLGRWQHPAFIGVGVLLVASNLLVLNQYLTQFAVYGSTNIWTDALFPLADKLKGSNASAIFCMDWGILNSTRYLTSFQKPLDNGSDPLQNAEPTPNDLRVFSYYAGSPSHLFVAYADGREIFTQANQRRRRLAELTGFREEPIEAVYDRNGRRMFEVFRYQKR